MKKNKIVYNTQNIYELIKDGKEVIYIDSNVIITPSAMDIIRSKRIEVAYKKDNNDEAGCNCCCCDSNNDNEIVKQTIKNLSIGIIETTGYVATISALDTLLNASNVEVIDKELIGAGIVVIIIAGSISNIKEAVKSAEISIKKLNSKCRHTIIAKPHDDVWKIIP